MKGGLHWIDGAGQQETGDGWQVQGAPRPLFHMSEEKIAAPPGLPMPRTKTWNMFGAFEEDGEDIELPEAEDDTLMGYQPKPQEVASVRKTSARKPMKKVERKAWKPVDDGHAMTFYAEPLPEAVHALSGSSWISVDPNTRCRRVKSVMDSGASDCCAPPELAPEVPIEESAGSRRGQKYSTAGGKSLENLGQKTVQMVTNGGDPTLGTWQMVEVMRPLTSVKKVCDRGNRVIFGSGGGIIQNIYTGEEIPFGVEDGIYVLDLWLPPEEDGQVRGAEVGGGAAVSGSGFPGQGWSR